ncbi:MAG: DUF3995 domain-containing protein [Solirubrobacteraceae bacterium]
MPTTESQLTGTIASEMVPPPGVKGLRIAQTALLVGLLYAAWSVYWGLGGTALGDTIGGSLERLGRSGDVGVVLALWAAALLKVCAAVVPLLAISARTGPRSRRRLRMLGWIAAVILTFYGLVLTVAGLLVQAGVIGASSTADHRALRWHAYLWDPWFLIWGLLIAAALLRSGRNGAVRSSPGLRGDRGTMERARDIITGGDREQDKSGSQEAETGS